MIIRRLSAALILLTISLCSYAKFLPPAQSQHGMVVSADATATRVGVSILQQGGNAVDAAVAVGYALAVTHPCCGNIGGGGFMTLHLANGKNVFIDFREKAPAAVTPALFKKNGKVDSSRLLTGYLGAGVPGTVMGLNTALQRYGTLPLKQVMQPAIDLAQKGHVVSAYETKLYDYAAKQLLKDPEAKATFFKNNRPAQPGTLLKQPNLAHTLELISEKGSGAFYRGPIAQQLVTANHQNGGVMTLKDLENYRVTVTKPLRCHFRGYTALSAPPPGSGVTVCEILKIVAPDKLKKLGFHAADGSRETLEAMRYAFYDRNQGLGDPAFVKNPTKRLLSKQHIQKIQRAIKRNGVTNSSQLLATQTLAREKQQTTHFTVVDKAHDVVSVTVTLNGFFGGKVMPKGTGFFINNELDDFAIDTKTSNQFGLIQGKANLIAGNKRPLSSMSPTIILNSKQQPLLALGAAGGSTIITSIVQTIENNLIYGMDINSAVNMPRYHMQWMPDQVFMEPYAFSKDTQHKLQAMGYHLTLGFLGKETHWGQVAAISLSGNQLYGANDNRRPNGLALGVGENVTTSDNIG